MYLHFMIGLLAAGSYERRAERRGDTRTALAPPRHLSLLSDSQLRDIGYERERVRVPTRHLMWM